MVTTDPVNAAVARALAYGTELVKSGQAVDFAPRNILPWAAREALVPIRARHYPVTQANPKNGQKYTMCAYCAGPSLERPEGRWPCDDARDAYTSEELQ